MSWRGLVGPLLAWKAGFFVWVLVAVAVLPMMFHRGYYEGNPRWSSGGSPTMIEARLSTWDAGHYLMLADRGYVPHDQSSRFPPLWPIAIRMAKPAFGGHTLAAALVLANLASLAALLLLFAMVAESHGPAAAMGSLAFLLAFPGSLFFHLAYSESLFLLLSVLAIRELRRGRYAGAMIAAFLLPLVRLPGALVVVPFAAHALGGGRAHRLAWFAPAAPLLGLGAYFLCMRLLLGDPLAGVRLYQGGLCGLTVMSLVDLPGFIRRLLDFGSVHGFLDSALDRTFFLLWVATLPRVWRLDRVWFWYVLPMGLFPAMTTCFMGFTRYAAVLFPSAVAAADLLSGERRRPWAAVVLSGFVVIQALFAVLYVNSRWVG